MAPYTESNSFATWDDDAPPAQTVDTGVVAGRYRLGPMLGQGGFGMVWEATDTVTGDRVALKRIPIPSDRDLQRVRRERAALWFTRLPGIVRIRDEGADGPSWFIVMDLVDGRPFPGGPTPTTWDVLAEPTRRLLDILARLHFAGVVHRDLKPGNVLVDRAGRVTVLDLGLAGGSALEGWVPANRFEGTPHYAAPEQCRGEPCDHRADLYSVGIMLFRAFTGRIPHDDPDPRKLLQQRAWGDPARLSDELVWAPRAVVEVIDRLLAPDPADRPDALEALHLLGGELPPVFAGTLPLAEGVPATEADLRALFHGPDVFHHLREDGAAELWARTAGRPEAVRSELAAWLRAGIGHWVDGAVRIERLDLERLADGLRLDLGVEKLPELTEGARTVLGWARTAWPEADRGGLEALCGGVPGGFAASWTELMDAGLVWCRPDGRVGTRPWARPVAWWSPEQRAAAHRRVAEGLPARHPARLRHLVEASEAPYRVVADGRVVTASLLEQGRRSEALRIGRLCLAVARTGGATDAVVDLLGLLTAAAIDLNEGEALATILYEVERTVNAPDAVSDLGRLVQAAQYARRREGERAQQVVASVPALDGPHLAFARQVVRYRAAMVRPMDERQALLDELVDWAEPRDDARPRVQEFLGLEAYHRGEYDRAAALHLAAVQRLRGPLRCAGLVNAASALMEAWDLDGAARAIEAAIVVARRHRLSFREAHATWVARSIAYRQGRPEHPRPRLVHAAERLGGPAAGLLGLSESAFAWRLGDRDAAFALGERAVDTMDALNMTAQAAFTRCFLEYLRPTVEAASLLEAARALPIADLRVQAVGLLYAAHPDLVGREELERLAADLPRAVHHRRLDLLSVAEALGESPLPPRSE